MTGSVIAWILATMILICLGVATVTDLSARIIPNRMVLAVLACGVSLRLMSGPIPLLESLLCAIAVLGALSVLGAYDFLGWGDVKLISSVTFIVPLDRVIPLIFAVAMAGGVLSCIYLTVRFALRHAASLPVAVGPDVSRISVVRRLARQEGARILANEPMPYALAILGGVAYGLSAEHIR